MADLKQIAERGLRLLAEMDEQPHSYQAENAYRVYVAEHFAGLARGYLSLLEENTRLRDAVDRAAGMLENACKQSCEPFRPYGKHAPECHWDIAQELREALGVKGERTGEP